MSEGSGGVRVLYCPKIPEPLEVKSRVRGWRVREGEVTGGRVRRIVGGSAHCGARE